MKVGWSVSLEMAWGVTGVLRPPRRSATSSTAALPAVRRRGKQGKKAATTACCLEGDAGESHGEGDVAAAHVGERCSPSFISSGSRRTREGERGTGFAADGALCRILPLRRGGELAFTVVSRTENRERLFAVDEGEGGLPVLSRSSIVVVADRKSS
nr:hypothetical protein Iba_chr04eCG20120 [Ipomoea batatas]